MVLVLVVWVALVGMGELVGLAVLVGMVGLAAVLEVAEMEVMGQDCLLHHKSCWCETHQAELHMPHNVSCRSS